ncbi:MAG: hypothetical protein KJO98_02075 [Rhodothermia bacterium]|nr:hypothetical protein [Rhodothermia bacterium]
MSKDIQGDIPAATGHSATGDEVDAALLRRMIVSVVHDLNNPLSIIAGNTQLLSEIVASSDAGDDIREPLRDIERAVEEMVSQLERLSTLTRPSNGPST